MAATGEPVVLQFQYVERIQTPPEAGRTFVCQPVSNSTGSHKIRGLLRD